MRLLLHTLNNQDYNSKKLSRSSKMYQFYARLSSQGKFRASQYKYNITISHQKRFIWFRVAKVGTRTLFNIFKSNGIPLSVQHAMNCHYPESHYPDYFKFAIVRNPWDRLVSCWHNKVLDHNYFGFDNSTYSKMKIFSNFVNYVEEVGVHNSDPHLRAQSRLIDLNNISYIGRFERFDNSICEILSQIGTNDNYIPKINTSKKRSDYRSYYSQSLLNRVGEIYKSDIHTFNYDF